MGYSALLNCREGVKNIDKVHSQIVGGCDVFAHACGWGCVVEACANSLQAALGQC